MSYDLIDGAGRKEKNEKRRWELSNKNINMQINISDTEERERKRENGLNIFFKNLHI